MLYNSIINLIDGEHLQIYWNIRLKSQSKQPNIPCRKLTDQIYYTNTSPQIRVHISIMSNLLYSVKES